MSHCSRKDGKFKFGGGIWFRSIDMIVCQHADVACFISEAVNK